MKPSTFLLLLVVLALWISACSKKDDDPGKHKYAWVVGGQDSTGYAVILFTPDGGATWQRQGEGNPALAGADLSDVWAIDENHVWAVGQRNTILKTSDGGSTWTLVAAPADPALPDLIAISIAEKTDIWISGSHGTVYHSDNDGSSWTRFDTSYFRLGGLQGICAVTGEKVFVVGGVNQGGPESGIICSTVDGGENWDSVTLPNQFNRNEWISVASSGNTVVVYGIKAHYSVSFDGGLTWNNDSVPGTGGTNGSDINHLIMLNEQTWWGAFDQGQIFKTYDAGHTWNKQVTGQGGYYLVGIDAWDDQLAIVVGAPLSYPLQGPVIKTTDGGNTWTQQAIIKSWLWKVSFIKNQS